MRGRKYSCYSYSSLSLPNATLELIAAKTVVIDLYLLLYFLLLLISVIIK